MPPFPYDLAFDRNLGWITDWEQLALRGSRIAIAGMGGVGGIHLLTLARLGIGAFNIADFDMFEFANFNRQVGAMISTIGQSKVETLARMALDINPELSIRQFPEGVKLDRVDDFLDGVDLFIDGLDFFEIPIRRAIFARCHVLGIPAITAAPIGTGTGYLVFHPKGMTFDQYFRMEGRPPEEQFLRFLIGLVPKGLHRRYLVDPGRINLAARKGPSTAAAVQLCAGVTAAAALKLLLNRPGIKAAPWHHHFDAMLDRMAVTWLPLGLGGPIQQAKLAIARRTIRKGRAKHPATPPADPPEIGRTAIHEILNLARWAPSGDNAQPWQFTIHGDDTVVIRLRHDPTSPYEYNDGEPTVLSAGMLLASIRVAASGWGRSATWRSVAPHEIQVRLNQDGTKPDPLLKILPLRSVNRGPYRTRRLTAAERSALEAALGPDLAVRWVQETRQRLAVGRLNARATDIRLRCPEAFPIHQSVIDWHRRLSPRGIPAEAVGLARPMLPLFRWALADWHRMRMMNRGGTFGAAAQLDHLPALRTGAFAVFSLPGGEPGLDQILRAGEALQRFWLTATRLGLAMQPTIAPVAFGRYGETGQAFTADSSLRDKARTLAQAFRDTLGVAPSQVIFLARVGEAGRKLPMIRSGRLSLAELMIVEPRR